MEVARWTTVQLLQMVNNSSTLYSIRLSWRAVVGLIEDEMSKYDLETPLDADKHVFEHVYHRTAGGPPDYDEILKMLY